MKSKLILCVAVAFALGVTGCTGKYKQQIADKDAEIAQLRSQVQSLEERVRAEEARAQKLNSELDQALNEYKAKEQVWIEKENMKSIVTVSEGVLFGSGSTDLTPEGKQIVDRIAGVTKDHANRSILIEGHTDDVPIGVEYKEKYASNWELSSARACSVLRYLYWGHKVDAKRLSAVGYGEHRPIASNDTPDGRGKNRRVVIVIGPEEKKM